MLEKIITIISTVMLIGFLVGGLIFASNAPTEKEMYPQVFTSIEK